MATFWFRCPHCLKQHPMIWGQPGTVVADKENGGLKVQCPNLKETKWG